MVGGYGYIGLTTDVEVRAVAQAFLPYACGYIVVSFYAFQLDGVFIGTTRSREMRNASVVSLLVFLTCSAGLTVHAGNAGLWLAFIIYVVVRGVTLVYYMPRVIAMFNRS